MKTPNEEKGTRRLVIYIDELLYQELKRRKENHNFPRAVSLSQEVIAVLLGESPPLEILGADGRPVRALQAWLESTGHPLAQEGYDDGSGTN